jgi:4-diphosphocytidyl-2-C-methyl-D-erythritol kinase
MPDFAEVDAPAKTNLFLRVLAREESGFHGLETLFCALSLADTVRVRRGAPGVRLHVEGSVDTGPVERNLCVRAAREFYLRTGEEPAVDIHLVKRIPAQAGLGGGSSDGAATLRALNALHGGTIPDDSLGWLSGGLGSDVPFFLCGSTLALGWSRGERLLALPPLPGRHVVIVHPGLAMPTDEAFRVIAEWRGEGGYHPDPRVLAPHHLSDWDAVTRLADNDFERVVAERIPAVELAIAALREKGARIAMMAGSGSSVFGVFNDWYDRDQALDYVRGLRMKAWSAETLERMPDVRVG